MPICYNGKYLAYVGLGIRCVECVQMSTDVNEPKTFVDGLIKRLQGMYAEQATLPDREEAEVLSVQMLQRLYRYILSEGYGE